MSIGERLKSARHERQMTLAQLAKASDLTKGFLSQVERGYSLPSLGSLRRLSSALDMPVESLVAGQAGPRGNAATRSTGAHIYPDTLSPDLENSRLALARVAGAEVSLLALKPGQRLSLDHTQAGDSVADGTALCILLSGAVWFEAGDISDELANGDAATFDTLVEFSLLNKSATPAALLLVSALPAEAFCVVDEVVVPPRGGFSAVDADGPLKLVAMRARRQGRRGR